jgi:tripartite-type tricarboxylate transporter receptor subunit TctC
MRSIRFGCKPLSYRGNRAGTIWAPATRSIGSGPGLPRPIVNQIDGATAKAVKQPEFDKMLAAAGLEPRNDVTPAGAQTFLTAERELRFTN